MIQKVQTVLMVKTEVFRMVDRGFCLSSSIERVLTFCLKSGESLVEELRSGNRGVSSDSCKSGWLSESGGLLKGNEVIGSE